MKKYKHIMAAVDLAENSEKVVEQAREMATLFGAELSLIHVVEPLPGYGYAFIAPTDIESEIANEAKKQLKALATKYNITKHFVEMGPAKMQILEKAKAENVDLIVVGTHKHILLGVLGSTANAIIHGAECDVLTFRIDSNE